MHDRRLIYGDGLFGTLAVRASMSRLLKRHLARLEEGCRRLTILLDTAASRQELLVFRAALGDGVIKLIVIRGEGLRGYMPPAEASSWRILSGSPRSAHPERHWQQSVRLFACRTHLVEQPLLADLKRLNCLEQVLTHAGWGDTGYTEGSMLDVHERVVKNMLNDLLLVPDDTLVASGLRCCGVAGVTHTELFERAEGISILLVIRDVSMAELAMVDEVFSCNSQFGIWPVRILDGHAWSVGELTRKLQDQLRDNLNF